MMPCSYIRYFILCPSLALIPLHEQDFLTIFNSYSQLRVKEKEKELQKIFAERER